MDANVRRIVLLSSRSVEEMGDERLPAAERTGARVRRRMDDRACRLVTASGSRRRAAIRARRSSTLATSPPVVADDYRAQQLMLGFPDEQTEARITAFAAVRARARTSRGDDVCRVTAASRRPSRRTPQTPPPPVPGNRAYVGHPGDARMAYSASVSRPESAHAGGTGGPRRSCNRPSSQSVCGMTPRLGAAAHGLRQLQRPARGLRGG